MEGINLLATNNNNNSSCGGSRENVISSGGDGRPPNPISAAVYHHHTLTSDNPIVVGPTSCRKCLLRHPSLVKNRNSDLSLEGMNINSTVTQLLPVLRSGAWTDIGSRSTMEDVYICTDDFKNDYGLKSIDKAPSAFYGVFDGHGGRHAADFACYHLPRFIAEGKDFAQEIESSIASAFLQTDTAFAEACSLDADLASGTTALAALVIGSSLVVANAGDCRAVLCRRGKAVEMSRDHKPVCLKEKKRIEASGGYVYDGYLNGQLNVARALGDWHMDGLKGQEGGGPLSAEPEFMTTILTEEDEFLIIGCDGIWDVFRSQNAVDFARRKLQEHNDPLTCCKDIVDEALKRKSGDNLAVVVVCFHSQPPPKLVAPRAGPGRVHRSISAEGLKELQSFLDTLRE